MTEVKVAAIVAMAENRVIGVDNQLPWHLPEDLGYFKRTTMSKPIIMGRKTYESIGRPLPGRANIVITRQASWQPDPSPGSEGVLITATPEEALSKAKELALESGQDEVMVIGGAEIYKLALPYCQRLYLTEVEANPDGDAWFPELNQGDWREVGRDSYSACEKNPFDYHFVTLERT